MWGLAGPIQQRSATARSAVLRKDILHLTARKTGIHNMPKSGGRKGRPQGCSLCSHRLRRLKPLTPTLSPATHSAMPCMLPCCTSDLNRRGEFANLSPMSSSRTSGAINPRNGAQGRARIDLRKNPALPAGRLKFPIWIYWLRRPRSSAVRAVAFPQRGEDFTQTLNA